MAGETSADGIPSVAITPSPSLSTISQNGTPQPTRAKTPFVENKGEKYKSLSGDKTVEFLLSRAFFRKTKSIEGALGSAFFRLTAERLIA